METREDDDEGFSSNEDTWNEELYSILDGCAEKFRKLEASQNSIVETSEYLLKLIKATPNCINEVLGLWCNFLFRSNKNQKVAFIFLANDLV